MVLLFDISPLLADREPESDFFELAESLAVRLLLLIERDELAGVADGCELSLTLCADEEIALLNRDYRGKSSPTDVLSFPLHDDPRYPEPLPVSGEPLALGDVVISLDTCLRQAAEIGHSPSEEYARLLVHGLLHLCAYDHELGPAQEQAMQRREDELLAELLS